MTDGLGAEMHSLMKELYASAARARSLAGVEAGAHCEEPPAESRRG